MHLSALLSSLSLFLKMLVHSLHPSSPSMESSLSLQAKTQNLEGGLIKSSNLEVFERLDYSGQSSKTDTRHVHDTNTFQ